MNVARPNEKLTGALLRRLIVLYAIHAVMQVEAQSSLKAQSFPPELRVKDVQLQSTDRPANVLSADQWKHVDAAVHRALGWLASQQQPDGSFSTLDSGQPAVTSLCAMAF